MPLTVSNLGELLGVILIAVAIGALFGLWWGVLVVGGLLVAYAWALDMRSPKSDA